MPANYKIVLTPLAKGCRREIRVHRRPGSRGARPNPAFSCGRDVLRKYALSYIRDGRPGIYLYAGADGRRNRPASGYLQPQGRKAPREGAARRSNVELPATRQRLTAAHQLRLRSTSARCLIHGIIARSLAPISSIGCVAILARMALNDVWLTRFSSIHSLANLPDWMSSRMRFISARVSSLTTRGPETYSPYSAVFETE